MYKSKKILALIPARSGSKTINNKNITKLGKSSLLEISIKFVLKNKFIDYALLSSDSLKYINHAKKAGIKNYILRKKKLSGDNAKIQDVIFDTLKILEKKNLKFDILILLEPTSPLRINSDILQSLKTFIKYNAYSVFTVSEVDSKFHPDKILTISQKKISYYSKRGITINNKQELTSKYYYKNGLVYVIDIKKFMKHKLIISKNTYPVVTDRLISNIDNKFDLSFANYLFKYENKY